MMAMENQKVFNELQDEETIWRLAKECISKIDAAGGIGAKSGGAEKVALKMLKIIRKQKRQTAQPSTVNKGTG